jgi:hypothetical protein
MLSRICLMLGLLGTLSACSTNPELGGSSGNAATGSAAGTATTHANDQLEHCSAALGTVAVLEDEQAPWYAYLAQYRLPSTVPLLRLIIQQSGCFVIVDRGRGLNSAMQERALGATGELRTGSKMGRGQIAAADYSMSPSINFSQNNTSGVGAALGFIPVAGGLLSAVAAGAHTNEASTTLILTDNRSSVQIAAAQGSAKNWDIGGIGGIIGIGAGGGIGGYSNTPEGKILVAAFTDSYNEMVRSLRNYQAQTVQGGLGTGGQLKVQGAP